MKVKNDEEMIIYGTVRIPLCVGKRSVDSEILISPDINGLVLGIDWLEKQGQFLGISANNELSFEDGEWLELQKADESRRVRRV